MQSEDMVAGPHHFQRFPLFLRVGLRQGRQTDQSRAGSLTNQLSEGWGHVDEMSSVWGAGAGSEPTAAATRFCVESV